MVEDSFTYAEADVEARLLIETRNEADTVLDSRRARPAPGRRRWSAPRSAPAIDAALARAAHGARRRRTATPSASARPT